MAEQVSLRRGTRDDARACSDLLWAAATDLGVRLGESLEGSSDDWWQTMGSLHEFLADHCAEWWVAEDQGSAEIVGYSRSVDREGLFELSELFVRPGKQSAGVGRQLIEHAFPSDRGDVRLIVATGDARALSRYHRAGTSIQFPVLSMSRAPSAVEPRGRLTAKPVDASRDVGELLAIDRRVVGYPRSEDEFRWLLRDREGYLFRIGDEAVGYAFIGKDGCGPIAALDPADQPQILAHVERRAADLGVEILEHEVPAVNTVAIHHLLDRSFKFAQWVNYFMADRAFGQFDRYVCFSPPLVL